MMRQDIYLLPDATGWLPRRLSLYRIVTFVSLGISTLLCMSVAAIIVMNARKAIEEETSSAFRNAQAAVAIRMPPRFAGKDTMGKAMRLAEELDSLRHVSSKIIDTRGAALQMRADSTEPRESQAPRWFNTLMRPEIQTDLYPISHYPNMLGSLQISTDPGDEIAEVWEDFRIIIPLLGLSMAVMLGLIMIVNAQILRRLGQIQEAIGAIRQGDLTRRAPDDRIIEFAVLADGVNDLASHLQAERAENSLLQTRLLTLSDAERARIASDLHDEMGPQLFALNAALAQALTAAKNLQREGRAQLDDALHAAATHAKAVRDSARTAINDLRPMLLGHGTLPELLEELVADFAEMRADVEINVKTNYDADAGELAELSIYRFVRESLLNAIRHGNAKRVEISMCCDSAEARQIVTRVVDDGCGPGDAVSGRGYGIAGIRDRAHAIGATYLPPKHEGGMTVTELRVTCQ